MSLVEELLFGVCYCNLISQITGWSGCYEFFNDGGESLGGDCGGVLVMWFGWWNELCRAHHWRDNDGIGLCNGLWCPCSIVVISCGIIHWKCM